MQGSTSSLVMSDNKVLLKGRYVIQQELGKGRFGTVFLVADVTSDTGKDLKVAKRISLENFEGEDLDKVMAEAEMQARLHHPNIVTYFHSFFDSSMFYIVTEYCDGGDLKSKIKAHKASGLPFSESVVINWFMQLMRAVEYMHEMNVIHRDVSPGNVFLMGDSMLKIGDFGCSRLLKNAVDVAQTFTGTPLYMSPEVLNLKDYDSKTDIWSCGCILYELCVLDTLFTVQGIIGLSIEVYNRQVPHLPTRYSSGLDHIFQSMVAKEAAQRSSASQILQDPFFDQRPRSGTASPRRRRERHRRLRNVGSNSLSVTREIDPDTWDWFNMLDLDKNGLLSINELRMVLFNSNGEPYDDKAMKVIFELFDVNNDDLFDVNEFAEMLQFIRRKQKEFDAATVNEMGRMDALTLDYAIRQYLGYELSRDTVRLAVAKFGNTGFLQSGGYLLATAFFKMCDEKFEDPVVGGKTFDSYVKTCLAEF